MCYMRFLWTTLRAYSFWNVIAVQNKLIAVHGLAVSTIVGHGGHYAKTSNCFSCSSRFRRPLNRSPVHFCITKSLKQILAGSTFGTSLRNADLYAVRLISPLRMNPTNPKMVGGTMPNMWLTTEPGSVDKLARDTGAWLKCSAVVGS